MPRKSMQAAINEALFLAMRLDEKVVLIGEDIAGGMGTGGEPDAWGGPFGVTKGLFSEFGENRVIDTPISESAFLGMAVGAANAGLRPVVEIMFADFFGVCLDQVINQAAKFRYMFAGAATPITVRTSYGAGVGAGAQHSQCLFPIFTHIPGLKVVVPSDAREAKGLLLQSIVDDDPVIFFEHKAMYSEKCEVPDEYYTIPLGKAHIRREGSDVTIAALGRLVKQAEKAAITLEADGIHSTVIDIRTTSPLDYATIFDSVSQTGRLVIADESYPRCGIASDLAGFAAARIFHQLKAPVGLVTPPHTPVPFASNLESLYLPNALVIENTVRQIMGDSK